VGNVADGTAKVKFSDWTTIAGKDGYVFTAPVGRFQANAFGLYDMHGNVSEWCADPYDAEYYRKSPAVDPQGPSSAENRVVRNASWSDGPSVSRSANRNWGTPAYRDMCWGFRVARNP
jgi:formylglycine-generating enzyme required for sulfatase activity